ncbi:MAG: alpha/beta hydrolase [Hyphomicrobiaceae bacterium]
MGAAPLQFLTVGAGVAERRIACLVESGTDDGRPGMIWFPGFKSEMTSTKASVLSEWAKMRGVSCTRFDYSGHGQSGGAFQEGTVGRWLEEAVAVFARLTVGPQILVGSSMGGYIALLLLRQLMQEQQAEAARVRALVLIAPAWDMTEQLMWTRFPESVRRTIQSEGVYLRPSQYGDEPYAITRSLIEEGRHHLIGTSQFNPGRPVHILHGLQDPDVPWEHTLDLVAHFSGDWTTVSAVPDGDHRLSRPEDLERLTGTLDALIGWQ